MLLYIDDISMLYTEDGTTAAIAVKARLSEKYMITNLGSACQLIRIEIHHKENCTHTGISLGVMAFITTILK
jgi:hypothetical protein